MSAEEENFDICNGKIRFQPCSKCGISHGLGIVSRDNQHIVVCASCGHSGPAGQTDQQAFEFWNDETRPHYSEGGLLPCQMERGDFVEFEWLSDTAVGALAKKRRLRPIGVVITRDDLPNFGPSDEPIAIQLLDVKIWLISPYEMYKKGRIMRRAVALEAKPVLPISSPNFYHVFGGF